MSAAVIGLEASLVEVEADTGGGDMGVFSVVGLPDAAVSESRERVRRAIKNSGQEFPPRQSHGQFGAGGFEKTRAEL